MRAKYAMLAAITLWSMTSAAEAHDHAFNQGYSACEVDGSPRSANPYQDQTAHESWDHGWQEAVDFHACNQSYDAFDPSDGTFEDPFAMDKNPFDDESE